MIPGWLAIELADGPISFERFMELALYHPEHGYYTRHIRGVGRGGDFSTSATLSKALGLAVAGWIRKEIATIKVSPPYHLIELGPGDGALAHGILAALPWSLRRKCRLHLVDVSSPLREQQECSLAKFRRRVSWHASLTEALGEIPPDAHPIIYSNEFFDAFPVRVFRQVDGELQELFIEQGDDQIRESWAGGATLPATQINPLELPEGNRFEVAESIHRWLQEQLADLPRGSLFTIDYGGSTTDLYHRRPMGSVRGYLFHNIVTGLEIYQNPGRQDLTADLNFDDLEAWATGIGVEKITRGSQGGFFALFFDDFDEDYQFLCSSAGESFKVLIQRKG